jgi:hypothetical protein
MPFRNYFNGLLEQDSTLIAVVDDAKDERVRALVMAAIQSGDSALAGQLSNPGGVMLELAGEDGSWRAW